MAKETKKIAKRRWPPLYVPVNRLFLDKDNPRLPEEAQGKSESELLKVLYNEFNLDELADSMAQNGYFDEEPLVVVPQKLPKTLTNIDHGSSDYKAFIKDKETKFIVVEGNRRLATAKLLLDEKLRKKFEIRSWPELDDSVENTIKDLPVIVYPERREVIPYLGVRHIVGIQKWDSYAKARYIASLVDTGRNLQDVEAEIGDTQGSTRKNYISYKLLEQAKQEFDIDTKPVKSDFSLLMLAIGQGKIKRYLGLPRKSADTNVDAPVPNEYIDNIQKLLSWIFGDGKATPVIKESRDITTYLAHVVASEEALKYLERTRDLHGAYDLSDGEEQMVLKYMAKANKNLEKVLGLIHRHKTPDVITEVEKCAETSNRLLKTVKEKE